jgi:hypothetical protein
MHATMETWPTALAIVKSSGASELQPPISGNTFAS